MTDDDHGHNNQLPVKARSQKELIWAVIDHLDGGATADEVGILLNLPYGANRRFSELVADGRLVDSGIRRRARSGRWAKVYVTIKAVNGEMIK